MSNRSCLCSGWKTGYKSLEEAQTIAGVHNWSYFGEYWKFCPWCGESLPGSKEQKPSVRSTMIPGTNIPTDSLQCTKCGRRHGWFEQCRCTK